MFFSFQIQYAKKTKVDDLITPQKNQILKNTFFNNQTILTTSIFHMYDVPINLPVYQTPSDGYGDITVILSPRAVKLPGGGGTPLKEDFNVVGFF